MHGLMRQGRQSLSSCLSRGLVTPEVYCVLTNDQQVAAHRNLIAFAAGEETLRRRAGEFLCSMGVGGIRCSVLFAAGHQETRRLNSLYRKGVT